MNSTIAAALIGVGGSVMVAIAGFWTTRSITLRQLGEAHISRIWDRQAAAYTDAITGVQSRQAKRNHDLFNVEQFGRPAPDQKPPVDWTELQGRLFAFASPDVLVALGTAGDAALKAEGLFAALEVLIRVADKAGDRWERSADTTDEIERLIGRAEQAVRVANGEDDALIDLIRESLHGKSDRALTKLGRAEADRYGSPEQGSHPEG
jgi:hypothetical protein